MNMKLSKNFKEINDYRSDILKILYLPNRAIILVNKDRKLIFFFLSYRNKMSKTSENEH